MVVQHCTISSQAYAVIRAAILEGRFTPGAKLVVRPLAEEMGLSQTPIKAALTALEREGLVEAVARHGFYVAQFDAADIKDVCVIRSALDRLAAEVTAAVPGRAALVKKLEASLAAQSTAVRRADARRYADLNAEFHLAICDGSQNRRLRRMVGDVYAQVRILTNMSAEAPGRPDDSLREHGEILAAIRSGDAVLAGHLAAAHAHGSELALHYVLTKNEE